MHTHTHRAALKFNQFFFGRKSVDPENLVIIPTYNFSSYRPIMRTHNRPSTNKLTLTTAYAFPTVVEEKGVCHCILNVPTLSAERHVGS